VHILDPTDDDDSSIGPIIGGVVGGIVPATTIITIITIIIIWKHKKKEVNIMHM